MAFIEIHSYPIYTTVNALNFFMALFREEVETEVVTLPVALQKSMLKLPLSWSDLCWGTSGCIKDLD